MIFELSPDSNFTKDPQRYILILHFIQSILTTVKKERKKDRCITEDYPTNKIALSSFKAN